MRLGVVFPQTEIGNDPAAIRDYAVAAEEAGYDHLLAYDHVTGSPLERFEGRLNFRPPYTDKTPFHEVFVLFGFLAGVTRRLEFTTGILIAPQRQTALIAKQAAALDVLSGGRLRLGLGVGWNFTEYEALNEDFHTRGRREAEQVEVLRKLWTEPLVTFEGRFHHFDRVGINPLPVQQPIPIWFGGMADALLRRVAKTGDGWFPQFQPGEQARATMERLHGYIREAGRDPSAVGIEGRITIHTGSPEEWRGQVDAWQELGATHLSVSTMGGGYTSPGQHIDAIRRFKEAVGTVRA